MNSMEKEIYGEHTFCYHFVFYEFSKAFFLEKKLSVYLFSTFGFQLSLDFYDSS